MDPSSFPGSGAQYLNPFGFPRTRFEKAFFYDKSSLYRAMKEDTEKAQESGQSNVADDEAQEETSKRRRRAQKTQVEQEEEQERSKYEQKWRKDWKKAEPRRRLRHEGVQVKQREHSVLSELLLEFLVDCAVEMLFHLVSQCVKAYFREQWRQERKRAGQEQHDDSDAGSQALGEAPLDFYALLGILPSATQDEVQKAVRKKRIETHPDRFHGQDLSPTEIEELLDRSKMTGQAADILCDPIARSRYDSELHTWNRRQKAAGRPEWTWGTDEAPAQDTCPSKPAKRNHETFGDWLTTCISFLFLDE